MQRTQHPSNNAVLGAPSGWDQAQTPCNALPITRTEIDGMPAIISFWRPSPEEIAQIVNGGLIALWTLGTTTAPVSLTVES